MIRVNENYRKLQSSYLFSEIAKRVAAFQKANPDMDVIKLGIGDVTQPLPEACIKAFHEGVDDLASGTSFKGYGPEQGYPFLREKIAAHDFQARNTDIDSSEIFVSDGSKCDTANIQELFAIDIKVAIPDPVYPVYLDTNVMAGRTGVLKDGRYGGVVYMPSTAESDFLPTFPEEPVDLIYLCFPNNPTGATISKAALSQWVDFAKDAKALILFDAAYESFIREDSLPHTMDLTGKYPPPRLPGIQLPSSMGLVAEESEGLPVQQEQASWLAAIQGVPQPHRVETTRQAKPSPTTVRR